MTNFWTFTDIIFDFIASWIYPDLQFYGSWFLWAKGLVPWIQIIILPCCINLLFRQYMRTSENLLKLKSKVIIFYEYWNKIKTQELMPKMYFIWFYPFHFLSIRITLNIYVLKHVSLWIQNRILLNCAFEIPTAAHVLVVYWCMHGDVMRCSIFCSL